MNAEAYDRPIGPWPRTLPQGVIKKITPTELAASVLHSDERVLVLNKNGDIPCHPAKDGPWSCLASAVREHFAVEAAHLVFRLDRETSGVVVFAQNAATASKVQKAIQQRRYAKVYHALLVGELVGEVLVDQPLGNDYESPVAIKSKVVAVGEGQTAVTRFMPLLSRGGYTLVKVVTETGRKHQIRAHAQWLGHSLVGDKIYGPNPQLFLDFVKDGWTPALAEVLHLPRQALHCAEVDLRLSGLDYVFHAPLPADMLEFLEKRMGVGPGEVAALV